MCVCAPTWSALVCVSLPTGCPLAIPLAPAGQVDLGPVAIATRISHLPNPRHSLKETERESERRRAQREPTWSPKGAAYLSPSRSNQAGPVRPLFRSFAAGDLERPAHPSAKVLAFKSAQRVINGNDQHHIPLIQVK